MSTIMSYMMISLKKHVRNKTSQITIQGYVITIRQKILSRLH